MVSATSPNENVEEGEVVEQSELCVTVERTRRFAPDMHIEDDFEPRLKLPK